jgi:hypothetical protein
MYSSNTPLWRGAQLRKAQGQLYLLLFGYQPADKRFLLTALLLSFLAAVGCGKLTHYMSDAGNLSAALHIFRINTLRVLAHFHLTGVCNE